MTNFSSKSEIFKTHLNPSVLLFRRNSSRNFAIPHKYETQPGNFSFIKNRKYLNITQCFPFFFIPPPPPSFLFTAVRRMFCDSIDFCGSDILFIAEASLVHEIELRSFYNISAPTFYARRKFKYCVISPCAILKLCDFDSGRVRIVLFRVRITTISGICPRISL